MMDRQDGRAAPPPRRQGVSLARADLLGGLLVLAAAALVLLRSAVLP